MDIEIEQDVTEDVVTPQEESSEIVIDQEPEEVITDDGELVEYEPNFSYKVKDEERQFDERLRKVISDKETEEYIRDLYTKADGLDTYKQKLEDRESKLAEYERKVSELVNGYQQLKTLRDEGNYRKLMSSIGLDDEAVLNYASSLIEEMNMPEEQRQIIQKNREYEERMEALNNKLATYESKVQSFEEISTQNLIKSQMDELQGYVNSNDDVAKVLKEKGLDLTQEVLAHGLMVTRQTGVEPSVKEAFDAVVNKYKQFVTSPQEAVADIVKNRAKTLPKIKASKESGHVEVMTLDKLRAMANKIR